MKIKIVKKATASKKPNMYCDYLVDAPPLDKN